MEATDDAFWDQFWTDTTTTVQDVFALVPASEIRAVREESPSNLATLCYKVHAVWTLSSKCVCVWDEIARGPAFSPSCNNCFEMLQDLFVRGRHSLSARHCLMLSDVVRQLPFLSLCFPSLGSSFRLKLPIRYKTDRLRYSLPVLFFFYYLL